MALLEEGLFGWLSSRTALTAYVSTRIYPGRMPQRPTYPAITYFRVTTDPLTTFDIGPGAKERAAMQFDVWSDDYLEARRVAEVLRLELQNFKGMMGPVYVDSISQTGGRDLPPDDGGQDPGIHHIAIEFSVWHSTPTV